MATATATATLPWLIPETLLLRHGQYVPQLRFIQSDIALMCRFEVLLMIC